MRYVGQRVHTVPALLIDGEGSGGGERIAPPLPLSSPPGGEGTLIYVCQPERGGGRCNGVPSLTKSLLTPQIASIIVVPAPPGCLVSILHIAVRLNEGHTNETNVDSAVLSVARDGPLPITTSLLHSAPALDTHLIPSQRGVTPTILVPRT